MLLEDYCQRCARLLAPLEGSHINEQAGCVRLAIDTHGRLVRRAWRSSYPQEGGEYLYQCQDCPKWWGRIFWTCVPIEDLVRYDVMSVEAWVSEQPYGEVES